MNTASEQGAYFIPKVLCERPRDRGMTVLCHLEADRQTEQGTTAEDIAEVPALEMILCVQDMPSSRTQDMH